MFSTLEWFNTPLPESPSPQSTGSFSQTSTRLILRPPPNRDLWRKTYYTPLLIKDDASALLTSFPTNSTATVTVDFSAQNQFDQGGFLIRVDSEHWIKFGFELYDGHIRLGAVVTNSFSDWSTMPWDSDGGRAKVKLRVHRMESSVALEAARVDDEFEMVRIAHLGGEGQWRIGPFAASPVKEGCEAAFERFDVGELQKPAHGFQL